MEERSKGHRKRVKGNRKLLEGRTELINMVRKQRRKGNNKRRMTARKEAYKEE